MDKIRHVLIVVGFASMHAHTEIPIRKHGLSGEVVADGSIDMSNNFVDVMPELSGSLVRKATVGQVSADGSIKIYGHLDDELSANLVRKVPEGQASADGNIESYESLPDGTPSLSSSLTRKINDIEHMEGKDAHHRRYATPSPPDFTQLTFNGYRCIGAPSIRWANLGKGKTLYQCKNKCKQRPSCHFLVHRAWNGACTEFLTCSTFTYDPNGPFTAWERTQLCYVHIQSPNLATPTANVAFNSAPNIPPWNDDPCYLDNWQRWCDHELNEGCYACENQLGAGLYCQDHCAVKGCILRMSSNLAAARSLLDGKAHHASLALQTLHKEPVGLSACSFCKHNYCSDADCSDRFDTCLGNNFWPPGLMAEPLMSGDRRRDAGRGLGYEFHHNDESICFAADWNPDGNGGTVMQFGSRMNASEANVAVRNMCNCLHQFLVRCAQGGSCVRNELCNCPHICAGFKQDWGCSGRSLAQTSARTTPKTSSGLGRTAKPGNSLFALFKKKRQQIGQQLHARARVNDYTDLDESLVRKNC